MASAPYIEIEEFDQANNLIATYIQSPAGGKEKKGRVDVIIPENSHGYAWSILNAFLPAGYPHSVTSDYLEYQIYDSLQAFSSSIASLLSSRAVLEGLGVGSSTATPTSALLLSVLQESMGRIATILFASRLGTSLEPECKMYRLLADIFNDAAMVLDCLSPVFPKTLRVVVLGASSCLRSLCGVAAGSSKASLSAHFAVVGNLGELNAKDSSQETVISLMGMLVGSLVVSHISSKWATWLALIFLLFIHLGTNYLAVRAVCMRTLNRQRANLVFSEVIKQLLTQSLEASMLEQPSDALYNTREVKLPFCPSPEHVRIQEKVFERDGILRVDGECVGYCRVGDNLQSIIDTLDPGDVRQGDRGTKLQRLLKIFQHEDYIIGFDEPRDMYLIILKEKATTASILRAWLLVLLVATQRAKGKHEDEDVVDILARSYRYVTHIKESLFRQLGEAGWDLEVGAMETRSGCRIRFKSQF